MLRGGDRRFYFSAGAGFVALAVEMADLGGAGEATPQIGDVACVAFGSGRGAPPPDRMSRSTKAGSNPAEVTHNSRETSFGSEAVSKGVERLGVMVFREFADISEAGQWTPATRAQHTRAAKRYQTDLSDAEWRLIVAFLPEASSTGRRREWPMREIVNAIFHVLRGGITWRLLPATTASRKTPGLQGKMLHKRQNQNRRDALRHRVRNCEPVDLLLALPIVHPG